MIDRHVIKVGLMVVAILVLISIHRRNVESAKHLAGIHEVNTNILGVMNKVINEPKPAAVTTKPGMVVSPF